MASFDTFMALRDYVKGKISRYELEDSDPNIYHVREDRSNRGMSVVKLGFNDDKFWKTVGLGEDDVWFLKMITSSYSDYEFMDSYTIEDEFNQGYVVYGDLNEENKKKLKEIAELILPGEEFDLDNDDYKVKLSETLLSLFDNEMDWILGDYTSEKNSEISELKIKIDELKKLTSNDKNILDECKKYYLNRLNQKQSEIDKYKA
jgi:hypothetical protein